MSFQVAGTGLDAAVMFALIRAHQLDDTKRHARPCCEGTPSFSGGLDRIDSVNDDRPAGTEGCFSDSLRAHVRRKTRRLIAGDAGPPHRCFERIDPEITSSSLVSEGSADRRLA